MPKRPTVMRNGGSGNVNPTNRGPSVRRRASAYVKRIADLLFPVDGCRRKTHAGHKQGRSFFDHKNGLKRRC